MVSISKLEGELFLVFGYLGSKWLGMVVEAAVKRGIEVDSLYKENELELIVWNGSKVHYAGNEKDTLHDHKMEGDMRAYICGRAPALISEESEQGEYYINCLRLKGVKI